MKSDQKLEQALESWGEKEVEVPDVVVQKMEDMLGKIAVEQEKKTKKEEKVVTLDVVPKKRKRWKYVAAAASFVLAGLVTTYSISSDLQGYVQSLFVGTKLEKYVQPINRSATDQGITISVKEAFTEGNQITLYYDIKNAKGEYIPFFAIDGSGTNRLLKAKLIDPKTKKEVATILHSTGPADSKEYYDKRGLEPGVLRLSTDDNSDIPDGAQLVLHFTGFNVNGEDYDPKLKIPSFHAKGNWTLRFPLDTKKTKAQQQQFATSDKLVLPQGELSVINLDYRLTEPMLNLQFHSKSDYRVSVGKKNLEYELYDDKGTLLYDIKDDPFKVIAWTGSGDTRNSIRETFKLGLPKSSSYKLRIKGIWLNEPVKKLIPYNESVVIDGKTIQIEPPTKEPNGDFRMKVNGNFFDYDNDLFYSLQFLDANGQELVAPYSLSTSKNGPTFLYFSRSKIAPAQVMIESIPRYFPVDWTTIITPSQTK